MTAADQVLKIRNSLLPSTLDYAVRTSPYYKASLGEIYQRIQTVEDLLYLPILDKQTLLAHQETILCNPQPDDLIGFSSGTTGRPLATRRNRAEIEEMRKCWELVNAHAREVKQRRRLILDVASGSHGIPLPSVNTNVIRVTAQTEDQLSWIRELLSSAFHFPEMDTRISVLQIGVKNLQILTLYFLQEQARFDEFALEMISTSGYHLSEQWRQFLIEQWHATLIDSYSLSEFPGNAATACEDCGYYHFALPTLVPEIVHPLTHQPIQSGLGVLVLTGLYPFSQRQVLIRYSTGDLVECGPRCQHDPIGFRMKGRLSQSLLVQQDGEIYPALLSFDLHDVLDALPDVHRPYPAEWRSMQTASFVLRPDFHCLTLPLAVQPRMEQMEDERYQIELAIELNYRPEFFPEQVRGLAEHVIAQLSIRNQTLAKGLKEGRMELKVAFYPPSHALPGMVI